MADVTGHIDNQIVELNNAATEATLKLLLQSSMTANKQTVEQLKKLTQDGGILDSVAIDNVNQSMAKLPTTTDRTKAGLELMQEGVKVVLPALRMFENALTKLSSGTAKGSDMFSAFKDLPLGAGKISEVGAKLLNFQEDNMKSYQQLTKVGVGFAGDLGALREAAGKTYMSLENFTELSKKNSDVFARMGVSVDDGVNSFVSASNQFQKSTIGKQLKGLGYTADELNESMLSYVRLTGGRARQEMQTAEGQRALGEATASYLLELQAVSKLTGESNEDLKKRQYEIAQESTFQLHLAKLRASGEGDRADAEAAAVNSASLVSREHGILARATALQTVTTDVATRQMMSLSQGAVRATQEVMAQARLGIKRDSVEYKAQLIESDKNGVAKVSEQALLLLSEQGKMPGVTNMVKSSVVMIGKTREDMIQLLQRAENPKNKPELPNTPAQIQANINDQLMETSANWNKAFQAMVDAEMGHIQTAVTLFTDAINALSARIQKNPETSAHIWEIGAGLTGLLGTILSTIGGLAVGKKLLDTFQGKPAGGEPKPPKTPPAPKTVPPAGNNLVSNAGKKAALTAVEEAAMVGGKTFGARLLGSFVPLAGAAINGAMAKNAADKGNNLAAWLYGSSAAVNVAGAGLSATGIGIVPGLALDLAGGALSIAGIAAEYFDNSDKNKKEEPSKENQDAISLEKAKQDQRNREAKQAEEIFRTEIKLLNNNMSTLIKYMKDTAENTDKTYRKFDNSKLFREH